MKYFDYAATCPIDSEVLDTFVHASKEYFGNTSSLHDIGSKAHDLLTHCRQSLADGLEIEREGIYFTSGGTESNILAIQALAQNSSSKRIITSAAEHSSIHNVLSKLEEVGYDVIKVPFTAEGVVNLEKLEEALMDPAALVTIQAMNGEIGTAQPVNQIAALCRKHGAYFHSDCVQAFGKGIDVSLFDSFSLSSHKIYGPKGVGALYIRPSISFQSALPHGTHEGGVRPGTVNLPGVAGFTEAAANSLLHSEEHGEWIYSLKKHFIRKLKEAEEWVQWIGRPLQHKRSPILGMCLKDIDGQWMMLELNRKGFAVSTGTACQAGQQEPSKTLLSMGYTRASAQTFIRISFGKDTSIADVEALASQLKSLISTRKGITS